jgi:hypothetical protein
MLKSPQVVEFPDVLPSGVSVHFIPYSKNKIRTVRKKSMRLVTLLATQSLLLARTKENEARGSGACYWCLYQGTGCGSARDSTLGQ